MADSFPHPIVEIGFGTDPANTFGYLYLDDPIRGKLGVGKLAPDNVWTDVTPWLHTFSTQRGATRTEGPIIRYEAGTASVVLNNSDRRFDPTNLTGPYVSNGRTQVRPMRELRIRAAFDGVTRDVWRGFIDGWEIKHPAPTLSRVTVTATDGQKVLASYGRVALGAPAGNGELSGARVGRVLDSAEWPAQDRALDAGESAMQGTTLDGDAWTELLLTQDSEIGEVFIDAAGRVVFRGRHAIFERAGSATSQATFGSNRAGGELPFVTVVPAYDDADVRNVIRIARAGGVSQTAQDSASKQEFKIKTHERTDLLLTTDALSRDYAQYVLYLAKEPEYRFESLVVDPRAMPTQMFPQVLDRDFGDRVTVVSRPAGTSTGGTPTIVSNSLIVSDSLILAGGNGPEPTIRDAFIRGIVHEYGGTNRWRTTWALQSATRYQFLILDHATLGKLDFMPLAF